MSTSGTGLLNPLTQVVNLGEGYINGAKLSWTSTTAIVVGTGQLRDSTNNMDIIVGATRYANAVAASNSAATSVAVTISNAVNGAGGLDVGTIAADLLYSVYVIGDSRGENAGSALISLSATAPSLPLGYDCYRRVGTVRTTTLGAFLAFDQRGSGLARTMYYRASIATDITAGSSATFAAVDVSTLVPAQATEIIFKCHFTPTAADDELALRCGDSATDEGQAVASGSVGAVVTAAMLTCPCNATSASAVDYKVTGSAVAINVQGYVDQL